MQYLLWNFSNFINLQNYTKYNLYTTYFVIFPILYVEDPLEKKLGTAPLRLVVFRKFGWD